MPDSLSMLIMLHLRAERMQVRSVELLQPAHNAYVMAEYLRTYLTQVRQELAARLVERLYADGTGKPNKWWMAFQKRRFMNRSLGS
jgi:hypothetical protein